MSIKLTLKAVFSFGVSLVLAIGIGINAAMASTNAVPSSGHDIFTGTGSPTPYRYGPSYIVNSDGSIDMWTCSPGQFFWQEDYQVSGSAQADYLTGTNTAAQQFTATKSFYNVNLILPTTNLGSAGITISLYQWNTNYATTVAGTPLSTYTWAPGSIPQAPVPPAPPGSPISGSVTLPYPSSSTGPGYYAPGTYLWVISSPVGSVGAWQYSGSNSNVNYLNGSQSYGGDFIAQIYYANWDYIRHSVSTDGGATFGSETIALQPTNFSNDHYSTCDPSVVEFGGYYYIGYTSTMAATGASGEVYVARGTSPTGPWEKWNGSGWGGNSPVSFIKYSGPPLDFGSGEPSFVVVNNTLYIYYTLWSHDPTTGEPISQTRVATVSTTDPNWPKDVILQGVAIDKRDQTMDAADVKYISAYSKFFAITAASRLTPESYIQAWESTDGINFHPSNMSPTQLQPYLFQGGLSGKLSGNLDASASNFVGYAYGNTWALWNTALNPISLTNDDLPASPHIYSAMPKNGSVRLEFLADSTVTSYNVKYGTTPGSYTNTITGIGTAPDGPSSLTYTVTGLTNGTKYYFVVDAVNSSGTSSDGEAVSAIPQNYTLIPMATATASTELNGTNWAATNVIDGNFTTTYSSVGHSGPENSEWIYIDAGAQPGGNQTIARLVLTSRQPSQDASPKLSFGQIEVSNDSSTWFDVTGYGVTYTIVDDDGYPKTVIDFPQPISARYIRLLETELNVDYYGVYYLQLAEFQAYTTGETAFASSTYGAYVPDWMLDLDQNTVYSSVLHNTAAATEYAGVDLGSPQQVTGINLTPRTQNSQGLCFPVNFTLDSSTDGNTWTTIPGQSYSSYPNPSTTQSFNFSSPVVARYFRVNATSLGSCGSGTYAMQIATFTVKQGINFIATASSQLSGWAASNVQDGIPGTLWSSNVDTTSNATEWIQLDMGANYVVKDLRLVPRDYTYDYFPAQFEIQSSTDGSTWTTVQDYTLYSDPANPAAGNMARPGNPQLFYFHVPVTARYFRIYATQLRDGNNDNLYYFQLADVFIDQ